MSIWNYLQISMDVFFLVGIGVVWIRLNRPAKEDPRLSRGLQLLQSKISILEDLSDRTDSQVKQMLKLLEKKGSQVQEAIMSAKETVGLIEQSMNKSMEVAEIFEDKIPHEEIIERQSSKKYIEAARLAHEGLSPEEIAKKVSLDVAEIEFIAKVNKDRLMFSEDDLPKWAQKEEASMGMEMDISAMLPKKAKISDGFERNFEKAFESPEVSMDHLEELGKKFRDACDEVEAEDEKKAELSRKLKSGVNSAISSVLQPIEDVKSAIKTELEDLSTMKSKEDEFNWEEFVADEESAKKDEIDLNSIDKAMARLAKMEEKLDSKIEQQNSTNADLDFLEEQIEEIQVKPEPQVAKTPSFQVGIEENALQPEHIEMPKDNSPKKKMSFDLVSKVKQRAKEKIQSGEIRTRIKSSESIGDIQHLDFPEIKVNPNDHLS